MVLPQGRGMYWWLPHEVCVVGWLCCQRAMQVAGDGRMPCSGSGQRGLLRNRCVLQLLLLLLLLEWCL